MGIDDAIVVVEKGESACSGGRRLVILTYDTLMLAYAIPSTTRRVTVQNEEYLLSNEFLRYGKAIRFVLMPPRPARIIYKLSLSSL
jgi:hypothetical protein